MKYLICLLISLMFLLGQVRSSSEPVISCYWGSWSVYRSNVGTFTADMIPAAMCTHLVYGFAGLDEASFTIKSLDPWCDLPPSEGGGLNNYHNAIATKSKNPYLKVILSIGGWNEGSEKYSEMASSSVTRKIFIDSVVGWLQKYGFDGLDMDWEYPGQRGGKVTDKDNFSKLLKELREAFDPLGFTLTAAVSGAKSGIEISYDIAEMSKHVHYLHVMSYEYHSWYDDPHLRHQSPLYSKPDENPALNVVGAAAEVAVIENWTMRHYIEQGAPPEKLLLGIVSDARTFTLLSPDQHNVGDLAEGPGAIGLYTQSVGYLSMYELCISMNHGWQTVFDEDYQAPYSYGGNQWASYDNPKSVAIKTQFVKDNGLGGVMFWSLDLDDCKQLCSGDSGCYLLKSIYKALNGF